MTNLSFEGGGGSTALNWIPSTSYLSTERSLAAWPALAFQRPSIQEEISSKKHAGIPEIPFLFIFNLGIHYEGSNFGDIVITESKTSLQIFLL